MEIIVKDWMVGTHKLWQDGYDSSTSIWARDQGLNHDEWFVEAKNVIDTDAPRNSMRVPCTECAIVAGCSRGCNEG